MLGGRTITDREEQSLKEAKQKGKRIAEEAGILFSLHHSLFDATEPRELKAVLGYFIDRIEVQGKELIVYYSVVKPASENIVPVIGDPEGI